MLLNGYAGYSAYLVCSTDADMLGPSGQDTNLVFDQANGSDTLFSREGARSLWLRVGVPPGTPDLCADPTTTMLFNGLRGSLRTA